jgi:hypothetical protein
MNFTISQFEVRLIMESLDSYRDSIEDASKKVSSESLRTKMAEIQRNIVTLQRKIEAAQPAASAPARAA